jgi:hypothetical protein
VQLQDDTADTGEELTPEQTKEWRDAGPKVWGMCWPQGPPLAPKGVTWDPFAAAEWIASERRRLSLTGMDLNFEGPVLQADIDTGGEWSQALCANLRLRCPTLPIHFDSYKGSAAAMPGIPLDAYSSIGCRFAIQTFWGAEGLWDDPPTQIVKWMAGASPPIHKRFVKPVIRVTPNNEGKLPIWEEVFANWFQSGCKGGGFYYIDGADFDLLRQLIRLSISRGCAY